MAPIDEPLVVRSKNLFEQSILPQKNKNQISLSYSTIQVLFLNYSRGFLQSTNRVCE